MEDLVIRARDGDRDAFAALVHATSDRLYAIAARILRDGDLAEDALQGALVTAWRQLPTLRDPARFEAWVRRLLVHSCYAEARRRRSWTANVRVLPVDGPVGPDGLLSIVERDALDRAFRRVSVEHRAVFVLHHHLGPVPGRDRRDARHPGRDGSIATPLRDQVAARGRRGRRGAGRPRRTDGMTDERNFDRLARAWLDLMPDEAPDRTIAAVLQAVETAPQVRPPWRWLTRRFPNMNRLSMAAALAAAAVLAVGGGLWLTRSDGPSIGRPSPTPAPSASPSGRARAAAAQLPIELRHAGSVRSWRRLACRVGRGPVVPAHRAVDSLELTDRPASTSSCRTSPPAIRALLRLVARNSTGGCSAGRCRALRLDAVAEAARTLPAHRNGGRMRGSPAAFAGDW